MGYIDQYCQSCGFEEIRAQVEKYRSNYYMEELVRQCAEKYPNKIHFLSKERMSFVAAEPDMLYEKIKSNSLFSIV